jgi:hypothetical protein
MNKIEWIFAVILVFIGITCLTVSATWMFNPDTIQSYLATLFQICFWIAIPTIIGIVIYLVYQKKKGDS